MQSEDFNIRTFEEEYRSRHGSDPVTVESVRFIDAATDRPLRLAASFRRRLLAQNPLTGRLPHPLLLRSIDEFSQIFDHSDLFHSQIYAWDPKTGQLTVHLRPRNFYFGSLGQSYSSRGKVSLDYQLGFRNLLGYLDATSIKYEQRYRDGTSLQTTFSFPFFLAKNQSLNVDLGRSNSYLCEKLQTREGSIAAEVQQAPSPLETNTLRLELSRKQFLMEGDDFPDTDYLKYAAPVTALALSLTHKTQKNPFPNLFPWFQTRGSVEATLTPSAFAHAGKASLTNSFSLPLRRFFPRSELFRDSYKLFKMELEAHNAFTANFRLSKSGFISPFHRHFFSRMRGFANLSSNHPFPEGLEFDGLRNQLSWAGHLKLCMNHFPLFQGSVLKPFWHATGYATLFNLRQPVHASANCGVGFAYEVGPAARLELLYNFAHWSSRAPRSELNRTENFQVRLSLND